MSSCNCDYSGLTGTSCIYCSGDDNIVAKSTITQKRIWKQVRAASSTYAMNISAFNGGAAILASGSNVNWNQMSDRVVASVQPEISHTRGNSLRATLTSDRPGASTPGGKGVDVKHDSYARYLNRKKAGILKTQTTNSASAPLYGNKVNSIGIVAGSVNCCV